MTLPFCVADHGVFGFAIFMRLSFETRGVVEKLCGLSLDADLSPHVASAEFLTA
jgi:hypothetical protein